VEIDREALAAALLRTLTADRAASVPFVDWLQGVRIEDATSHSVIPVEAWPHLVERAASWERGTSEDVLKARQLGFSWLAAAYAVWTERRASSNVLVISQGQREAYELLRKCRFVAEHHSAPVGLSRATASEWELQGGGMIRALPSTEDAGRGYTATLVIVDEAAYHPYASQNYQAYYPTIGDGGQLITLSTSSGPQGWFYSRYLNSRHGVFVPWHARPDRDDAWRERTLAEMGEDAFMREYPATPDEAFAASTGLALPFDIRRHVRPDHPVPLSKTLLLHPRATNPGIAGIDPGGSDKTCVSILGAYRLVGARPNPIDAPKLGAGHGELIHWHKYAELYQSGGVTVDDMVEFMYSHGIQVCVGDFGDDSPIAEQIRRRGIFTYGAKKDRAAQHSKHLGLLTHNRLTIHESCTSYMEYLSYWWDAKSPIPYATKTGEGHHADAIQSVEYPIVWVEGGLERGTIQGPAPKVTMQRGSDTLSVNERSASVPRKVNTYR